jgi:hypothetical protein
MELSAAYCRIKIFKKEIKPLLNNLECYNYKNEINDLIENIQSILYYGSMNDLHSAIYLLREFHWHLANLILIHCSFDNDTYNMIIIMHKATCKALINDLKFEYTNKKTNYRIIYDCSNKFEMENIFPKIIDPGNSTL